MKKLALVAAALLLPISILATTDASADAKLAPAISTAPVATVRGPIVLQVPVVKGEITIPAALRTGEFAPLSCDKIEVVATSTEMVPCTGNGFCIPTPTWTRSHKATGSIATGKCEYTVIIPENKPFTVGAASDFHEVNVCGTTFVQSSGSNIVYLANQPMPSVTVNFSVTGLNYSRCPR